MNIPKAMKIGSGQTELKLDVVLHATAKKKKGNEHSKNKRHRDHPQQAFFLPPVVKVCLMAFFTQDRVCLRSGQHCARRCTLCTPVSLSSEYGHLHAQL